ncbi:MAG: CASTOR/POLLUX-related putative ion channel [Candidatus Kapaibacteriota bacterium]|jgi:hypothetical protein
MQKKNKAVLWIKYQFDNLMSKGTLAPLLLLLVVSIVAVMVLSCIILMTNSIPIDETGVLGVKNPKDANIFEVMYMTLLRMLDPGVISNDPINYKFIPFMLISTFMGLFVISILIAVVNSGVINKINDLRKGKSFVYERNHIVILGWSFQVFPVISELIISNLSKHKPVISILADKDKVFMEDEIKSKVGNTFNTKIVCRTGNPIDIHDLSIINLNEAKSIIIIAPDSKDPDSNVIKTILAITNNPHRKPAPDRYHIVAEIRDPRNVVIAEIAGKDEVQLVVFDYLISRITAQTCRQPGLSVVFTELLDFSGDEIYFEEEPKLYGKSFVEAMYAYDTSTIIGMRKKDGEIVLKPDFETIIREGDKIITISESQEKIALSKITNYNIDNTAIKPFAYKTVGMPESTLIIGWNRRAPLIINELDNYVAKGSKITIITDSHGVEYDLESQCNELKNQELEFRRGDTSNRKILDSIQIETYNHVIVLSQAGLEDVQATDARTLSTLLHLRDIADKKGHTYSIVSEMLDDRNRELAEVTNTDDFIVSVKIDSLMLSQIAENKELRMIFEDLFTAGGTAIYIKPASDFVEIGKPVNFYTVMESARQKGHIAIGMKIQSPENRYSSDIKLAHGVIVNPQKHKEFFFSKDDSIIILADEKDFN